MAPWTGKLLQSSLDKLTAANVEATAQRLVNLIETRAQLQKLALLVSRRIHRAYTPTFHPDYDQRRRDTADRFVGSLVACFANCRKPLKGIPTKEGLSGIPLLKADLLSAWTFEKTSIAPIATALYNSDTLTGEDVRTVALACLDKNYATDVDKVGDAILLLEHAARELDRDDERQLSDMMVKLKEHLDQVPEKACERRRSGERLIPSLYDRYWALVKKREEGWRKSPYGTSTFPSTTGDVDNEGGAGPSSSESHDTPHTPTSATALDMYGGEETKEGDVQLEEEDGATFTMDAAQPSPWLAYFAASAPLEVKRRESGAKVEGVAQDVPGDVDSPIVDAPAVDAPLQALPQRSTPSSGSSSKTKARPLPVVPPQPVGAIAGRNTTVGQDDLDAPRRSRRSPHSQASRRPSSGKGAAVAPPATAFPSQKQREQSTPSKPPRSRCASCSRDTTMDAPTEDAGLARSRSLHQSQPSVASMAGDQNNPPISFDDEDDSIWVHLAQAGSPIKVKFDPTTQLGDARRLARLLATSLSMAPDATPAAPSTAPAPTPIHFLPNGKVGQTLRASKEAKPIFVEYPEHMTLLQARTAGDRLAGAVGSYSLQ